MWVENFDKITLSRMVKEIKPNLCFAIFGKNPKIQNGRHFWGGEFCIEYFPTTLRIKNSVQIALSLTVSEKLTFFRFSQKFKMAAKSGEN